jgi:hypothetical protein
LTKILAILEKMVPEILFRQPVWSIHQINPELADVKKILQAQPVLQNLESSPALNRPKIYFI